MPFSRRLLILVPFFILIMGTADKYSAIASLFVAPMLLLAQFSNASAVIAEPTDFSDSKIASDLKLKIKTAENEAKLSGTVSKDINVVIWMNERASKDHLDTKKDRLAELIQKDYGGKKIVKATMLPFIATAVPADKITKIAASKDVDMVYDGELVGQSNAGISAPLEKAKLGDTKPLASLIKLDTNNGRQTTRANLVTETGNGVKIAIIDSGIHRCSSPSTCHPDFAGRVINVIDYTSYGFDDNQGHGTVLATIAAASGVTSGGLYKGIAPSATLLNIKVTNTGYILLTNVVQGIDQAVANGANIIVLAQTYSCFP